MRRRQVAHERTAVCFELWCQRAAQQRLAEHQVRHKCDKTEMLLHIIAGRLMCWFSMQTSSCMSQYVPNSVCATAAPEHDEPESTACCNLMLYDSIWHLACQSQQYTALGRLRA